MDSRKLLRKKPILSVVYNEKAETYTAEFGADVDTDDVYVSIVFLLETMAEHLGVDVNEVWAELEQYRRARLHK